MPVAVIVKVAFEPVLTLEFAGLEMVGATLVTVSTTHTITGAIIGVGAVHRLSAVRWGVARRVVWAWVLTIPCSAVVAAAVYWVLALLQHH